MNEAPVLLHHGQFLGTVDDMSLPATELQGFAHDALFYSDLDAFVRQVGRFVEEGVENGESVLVATDLAKCEALRDHIGSTDSITYLDLRTAGRNPARIIPVWREFLTGALAVGRGARGVGEPVWAGRSASELVECQHHETMLNLAFDDGPAWSLLCPYDTTALSDDVVDEAMRSHPGFLRDSEHHASTRYAGAERLDDQLARPLPPAEGSVAEIVFAGDAFGELRDQVAQQGRRAGVSRARLDDLALAVHELATNSVRHGGGQGTARLWRTEHS